MGDERATPSGWLPPVAPGTRPRLRPDPSAAGAAARAREQHRRLGARALDHRAGAADRLARDAVPRDAAVLGRRLGARAARERRGPRGRRAVDRADRGDRRVWRRWSSSSRCWRAASTSSSSATTCSASCASAATGRAAGCARRSTDGSRRSAARLRRPAGTRPSPLRDAESLHQAVPHDRRADAGAAGRLAGDGRPDALPPGAGVRRALRARARPPSRRVPDRQPGARVRRERLGRDGVGGREPRTARHEGTRARRRQVRRALDRALRGLRRRPRQARAGLGHAHRRRRRRSAADGAPRRRGGVRDAVGDLDRDRARRARDRRGRPAPRRAARRRRRVRARRDAAGAGRVGRRRRGRRLTEGADDAARAGVRVGVRARARGRGRQGRRALLLRLVPYGEEPGEGREPVHPGGVAVPRVSTSRWR